MDFRIVHGWLLSLLKVASWILRPDNSENIEIDYYFMLERILKKRTEYNTHSTDLGRGGDLLEWILKNRANIVTI